MTSVKAVNGDHVPPHACAPGVDPGHCGTCGRTLPRGGDPLCGPCADERDLVLQSGHPAAACVVCAGPTGRRVYSRPVVGSWSVPAKDEPALRPLVVETCACCDEDATHRAVLARGAKKSAAVSLCGEHLAAARARAAREGAELTATPIPEAV